MTKRFNLSVAAALIALLACSGTVGAEPVTPVPPPPPVTSTTDELTDMVLDAIEHGSPTTSVVPAPPP